MKVLDPQSALLTNVEVYQFLKANPPRTIDIQVGAYPTVNLAGHSTVRKDFDRYTEEITPYVKSHAEVQTWMTDLIKKLKPYELNKTEVMNLINLGVGAQVDTSAEQVDEDMKMEEGAEPDEDISFARDELRFRVAVEEAEERFPGEIGEGRIREVIEIMRATIRTDDTPKMNGKQDGAHPDEG